MSVYIACDKCEKRLKIPETVVGRPIKCPACGSVFKAEPAKVHPAKPAPAPNVAERAPAAVARHRTAPAVHEEEDEDIRPVRKKPAILEDEDEDLPKPRKKPAARDEDEDAISPVKKKAAIAADEDDEDRPARAKKRPVDDDEPEEVEEAEAKPGKRRTAWYVMLPLIILSLCGVGLAALWPIGFSFLDMQLGTNFDNRGLRHLDFETKMWIGIASAGAITLLCLIFSLIPARSWLRFLLVFLFLGLGYGGSFAAIHWWNDLPFVPPEEEKPFERPPPGGPMAPPGGGMGLPGGPPLGPGRGGNAPAPQP